MTQHLHAHGFDLICDAANGGVVRQFSRSGTHLLRPAPTGDVRPTEMAAFPLFPFSGRIENAAFQFGGKTHHLAKNFPPEPHAIHGQSWQSEWSVAAQREDALDFVMEHDGSQWPWPYRAQQSFQLVPGGLKIDLALTNQSRAPMPAGVGWHPYFPRGDAQLSCQVTGYWPNTDSYVPSHLQIPHGTTDLNTPKPVATTVLDNAFRSGGPAVLHWPSSGLQMTLRASAQLTHWIVYTPDNADFFCVEPVSHAPNAINMALPNSETGLVILPPGETLSAQIELQVAQG